MSEVTDILKDTVSDLVEGAADDVNNFLGDIAKDMVRARAANDSVSVAHLEAQINMLAAIHEVELAQATNRVLTKTIAIGKRLLVASLGAIV